MLFWNIRIIHKYHYQTNHERWKISFYAHQYAQTKFQLFCSQHWILLRELSTTVQMWTCILQAPAMGIIITSVLRAFNTHWVTIKIQEYFQWASTNGMLFLLQMISCSPFCLQTLFILFVHVKYQQTQKVTFQPGCNTLQHKLLFFRYTVWPILTLDTPNTRCTIKTSGQIHDRL